MIIQNNSILTEEQRVAWLHGHSEQVKDSLVAKYITGQAEHQSDLGSITTEKLFDELTAEHLDAINYLGEIRRRLVINTNFVLVKRETLTELMDFVDRIGKDHDIVNASITNLAYQDAKKVLELNKPQQRRTNEPV